MPAKKAFPVLRRDEEAPAAGEEEEHFQRRARVRVLVLQHGCLCDTNEPDDGLVAHEATVSAGTVRERAQRRRSVRGRRR